MNDACMHTEPALADLRVDALTAEEFCTYDAWHDALPHGTIYGQRRFADFVANVAGGTAEHLVARRGQRIAGVLTFAWRSVAGLGAVLNSLPWYGSHGGCWLSDSEDHETRVALLARFAERRAEIDPLFSTVVMSPLEQPHLATYRAALKPDVEVDRIGQISSIPEPGPALEQRILAGFEGKTRNQVRKSLQQGFSVRAQGSDADWRFLWESHVVNMAAIGGQAKPWEHFVAIRRAFPDARLTTALDGNRPVAAMLLVPGNRSIEYITPTSLVEERSRQPLTFLIHHGMLWAAEAGFRRWNWGGTWRTQASLHHFKQGFGAADEPYSYLISGSVSGAELLASRSADLKTAFPYWYLFPFDEAVR